MNEKFVELICLGNDLTYRKSKIRRNCHYEFRDKDCLNPKLVKNVIKICFDELEPEVIKELLQDLNKEYLSIDEYHQMLKDLSQIA